MQENIKQEARLKRALNPMHVWALAFGCIIGWGSFINPGKKFLFNSGVAGTAIAMLIGAVIMVVIAFNYAYMVPKYPKAGGQFTFAKICFGRLPAFLCGWFLVAAYLTNVPMNSTAIGLIIDGLFGPILKFGFHYTVAGFDIYAGEMAFAMAVLVLFGLFNIQGVKVAGSIQTLLAFLLGSSVLMLTAIALTSDAATFANMEPLWGFDKEAAVSALRDGSYGGIDPFVHTGTVSICAAVLATLAIAPWAYVGFDTIPQAAEEYQFSPTKVSLIMIVAISFGCFVYIANNTITAAALANWPDLIINSSHTPWLLLAASERLLGNFGKVIVGIAVFSAVLTGIMGFYMASSRLMYSMARDGYLPKSFAVIDPKHRTPKNALLFCIGISLSGPILGREALGWFVDMCAIGASIGFLFTCLATRVTMKRNGESDCFLSIVSILGAAFSVFFIALQLIPIPGLDFVHFGTPSYILLVVWILIGAGFYIGRFGFKVH